MDSALGPCSGPSLSVKPRFVLLSFAHGERGGTECGGNAGGGQPGDAANPDLLAASVDPMPDPAGRTRLDLDLELSAAEIDELRIALLRARAAELSEVRRRDIRLTAGYGDATNRAVMDDEARRAQMRFDALTRLLEALGRAEPTARADPTR
jgi:hypothetical protein